MNDLQQRLYQLLLEIDEVCNKNDILYYLSAGCALGAIRQGKFIEWDDDIDVFLTRDNWEKLKAILEKECPSNRKLVHTDNTLYYGNTVARYVDLDTISLRRSMMLCPEAMSVAVEIFILDPFPIEETAQKEHIRYMKLYSELLNPFMILNSGRTESEIGFDFELYREYRELIKEQGEAKILKCLEKKFTDITDSECEYYCMRWGRIPYLFSKKMLGGNRKERFEDHEFPVMLFAEESFRTGYGNGWMYLPLMSDQWIHNVPTELNYDNARRYSLSEGEKEELLVKYLRKKDINIEKIEIERVRDKIFANLQAKALSRKLSDQNKEGLFLNLLRDGNYAVLNDRFSDYYELINNERVKGHAVRIELSDELFYVAMMNLIMQGEYYKIPAYLTKEFDGISDEQYREELCGRYEFCRSLSIAIYDEHSVEKATEVIESNKNYIDIPDFHRGRLWVMSERAKTKADYTEIIDQADKSMINFGEDGEIICYKAEAMYFSGDRDGAREVFEKGVRRTRNGFLLRKAEELCDVKAPADIVYVDHIKYSPEGNLLMDFHKLCKEICVQYYLTGRKRKDNGSLAREHYFEVAMSHEDLTKLKAAIEANQTSPGSHFSLERVNGVMDEIYGRIRLYNKNSCVVDIRNYTDQTDYRAYISIYEIYKYGEKQDREQFEMMYSIWINNNAGKYKNKRKKTRLNAKGATLAGMVLSEKTKKNKLKKYKRRHFTISNEELSSKECRLRIGDRVIKSSALSAGNYIPLGTENIPVLWECRRKAQDAPPQTRRDLRYQILDSDRAFSDVITDADKPDLIRCCNYQAEHNQLNQMLDAETAVIRQTWKRLKQQITE